MPYSFRSRAARENRRLWMIVASVAAILIVAFMFFRRGSDERGGERPRVLGARDSTYVEEREIGVFEIDTTGYGDVPVTPLPNTTPEAGPRPAGQPGTQPQPKPASALALNNHAWSLHLAGKYAEAESELREVIRMSPARAIAYANLGETLWKQGENEEAAAMYRKFLELNKDPRRARIAQSKIAQITAR
jgi:tetratricopeptide (TPR) repeat protein